MEGRSLIMRVFLPFVAGYYLSFCSGRINALIAGPLSSELGLGAADLGLLTSVYFLTFAAAQIPIGVLSGPIWSSADPECILGGRGRRRGAVRLRRTIFWCSWLAEP